MKLGGNSECTLTLFNNPTGRGIPVATRKEKKNPTGT